MNLNAHKTTRDTLSQMKFQKFNLHLRSRHLLLLWVQIIARNFDFRSIKRYKTI